MEKIGLSDIMARFEAGHGGAWWSMVESGGEWYEPCTGHGFAIVLWFPFSTLPMNSFYCQERLIMVPKAGHRMIF